MAFQNAAGWNNLPNGNFSPTIYSQKVQKLTKQLLVRVILCKNKLGELLETPYIKDNQQPRLMNKRANIELLKNAIKYLVRFDGYPEREYTSSEVEAPSPSSEGEDIA